MESEPLFIFQPRSVLAIVSLVWAASGPVLSVVLSLFALTFRSWIARRFGSGASENDEEPFLRFSRAIFAAYALAGMIVIPSFVFILLAALVPEDRPEPFPAVLLINSGNLAVVVGYGLFCHFLASRLRTLFSGGR
ncbi:MAG: hypothetical protein ACLFWF_06465 [Alphaproteobacteria bacterium]